MNQGSLTHSGFSRVRAKSRRLLRRSVSKLARAPWTLGKLVVDRMFVPLRLRWMGVTVGHDCRFAGLPIVRLALGAQVVLGKNVHVYSRPSSNPAGLPHPTMLAAMTAHSSIKIGEGTGISGASIVARDGIAIGRYVLIGAGACIWDTDFHPLDADVRRRDQTRDARAAAIHIEDDVFIGARALILKGVRIGQGAIVGAGAVVTKNVPAYRIVAGNPARVVGSVNVPRSGIGASS